MVAGMALTSIVSLTQRWGRVGGLICYEHLQPLFKYALMAQGEQIHCACWPGSWPDYPPPGRSNKEIVQIASRAYAIEGSCFCGGCFDLYP